MPGLYKSKEKPFGCTFPGCQKFFARKDCQQLHMKSHTGEKSYTCDYMIKSCECVADCDHKADAACGKSFITSSHLNRHKKTHRDLFVHICNLCQMKYKKKSQLRQHKLDNHGIAEFLCQEDGCGRHFVSKAKLLSHQKARHGGFMCPVVSCSALFPSNDMLIDHISTHDSNVTLFKRRPRKKQKSATETDKSDLNDDDLSFDGDLDLLYAGGSYFDIHDDENDIDVIYSEEDDDDNDDDVYFLGHIRDGKRKRARSLSVSSDQGPSMNCKDKMKKFQCTYPGCVRSFNQNKNLEAHIKALHSKVKPYPCPEPYCERGFGFKSVLERHMLRCHGSITTISSNNTSHDNANDARDCKSEIDDKIGSEAINHGNDKYRWNNILGVCCKESAATV